jgi:hypothetical protein
MLWWTQKPITMLQFLIQTKFEKFGNMIIKGTMVKRCS